MNALKEILYKNAYQIIIQIFAVLIIVVGFALAIREELRVTTKRVSAVEIQVVKNTEDISSFDVLQNQQIETNKRLDRIETKIDRVLEK